MSTSLHVHVGYTSVANPEVRPLPAGLVALQGGVGREGMANPELRLLGGMALQEGVAHPKKLSPANQAAITWPQPTTPAY